MNLHEVNRGVHKNKAKRRVGRGPGSGHGKTSTRGSKGQGSRAGYSSLRVFEGGQMPLVRRIPKRGFNNRWAETVAIVNLDVLERQFASGDDVNPETLKSREIVRGGFDQLKVLGTGELTKKLKVAAHRFSQAAREKIEKAGGEVVVLPGKAPVVKNKMKSKVR
jgi:large subunit ribosomal protein L15